jgi:hypothetical protein
MKTFSIFGFRIEWYVNVERFKTIRVQLPLDAFKVKLYSDTKTFVITNKSEIDQGKTSVAIIRCYYKKYE